MELTKIKLSDVIRDRWRITIHFDDVATQVDAEPEYDYPGGDDCSRLRKFLMEQWAEDEETFREHSEWTDTSFETWVPVIDMLIDLLQWIPMHIIPKLVVLSREEER